MAKNSVQAYGAKSEGKLLYFDPAELKIATKQDHPLYDKEGNETPINPEMVASIKYKGVIEPILIWKDKETGDVYVADGRQRTKNNIEANKQLVKEGAEPKWIPAKVADGNASTITETMILANEGRRAVSAASRAAYAGKLKEKGYQNDVIAILLHCSESTVKNYLASLEVTQKVRDAYDAGKFGDGTLYSLAKLHPAKQNEKLAEILADKDVADADESEDDDKPTKSSKSKTKKAAKKRKSNKRARAIASGVVPMQGKRKVLKLKEKIENSEITPAKQTIMLAMIDWFLGKNTALKDLL